MNSLSVIIITHNVAATIRECLSSVKWANEIIIFDSGSTDSTLSICSEFTSHVYNTDWPGFGVQKNRALEKATGDWVLSLDADEIVTPPLAEEIQALLNSTSTADGYNILRKSYFCNRLINHGDWGNDYVLRLFKRGTAQFNTVPVHEKLILNGTTRKLKQYLLHHTAPSLADVIAKINRYSSLSATAKKAQGVHSSLHKALGHGLWAFLRSYIFKRGFLDGRAGFVLAVTIAEGTYYRYLKILDSL